jgi:hypothetical protein
MLVCQALNVVLEMTLIPRAYRMLRTMNLGKS